MISDSQLTVKKTENQFTYKYRDEALKLSHIRNKLKTTKHATYASTTKVTCLARRSIKESSWTEGGLVAGKCSVKKLFIRELVLKDEEGNRVYSLHKDCEVGMDNKVTSNKLKEVEMDDDVESDEEIEMAGKEKAEETILKGFESVFMSNDSALVLNVSFY